MDTFQTIASKRDLRSYAPDPVPDRVLESVLQAGRLSGNAMNREQRRFVVLGPAARARAAEAVTRPSNLQRAAAAVAIVTAGGQWATFDAGRAAQNMMLAAWNEGVGSCPNAFADRAAISELVGAGDEEQVEIVISFGYPPSRTKPDSRPADEWLAAADRKPLDDLVTRI